MRANVPRSVLLGVLCAGSFACLVSVAACEEKAPGSDRCGDGICDASGGETAVTCWLDCGGTLVSAGGGHICGVVGDGRVWCWGLNCYGQVGASDLENVTLPSEVPLEHDVVMVSSGGSHTCAVTTERIVFCWGDNADRQLGPLAEGAPYSPWPVLVPGLDEVVAISAGGGHICALKSNGTVWCWGHNRRYQLGDGWFEDSAVPVQPVGLENVVAISAGSVHTCAIKSDRTAWCWGFDIHGQLGDGDPGLPHHQSDFEPSQVVDLADVRSIAPGGRHTCAAVGDGTVWCWGDNSDWQLGVRDVSSSARPVQVSDVSGAISVAAGSGHTCVVHYDGSVSCWGRNGWGQIGSGYELDAQRPLQVIGVSAVVSVAAYDNTCVVNGDGGAWCWGPNSYGELGIGTNDGPEVCDMETPCSTVPVEVAEPF